MPARKIAITLDGKLLRELDELVARRAFANRSKGIQEAVRDKIERLKKTRLAREAAKLDPREERALAEEAIGADTWPDY
jgi:metal-responsive CopG/Arc/MetJ family transcriptional regulator